MSLSELDTSKSFQNLILKLQDYWATKGCAILQPFDMEIGAVYRHIGMYGFKRNTLFEFTAQKPSEREQKKSLEQLRALDFGIPIKALITNCDQMAVDTLEDLQRVAAVMGLDLDEEKIMDG